MKSPITQLSEYGCGIACFAFVCNITYSQAERFLGEKQAKSNRFVIKDFATELNRYGKKYARRHIKPNQRICPSEGMIVLIRRSKRYPVGHYLAYHQGQWMDPYMNLPGEKRVELAYSGYRKRLPGHPMYVLTPE